MGEDFLFGLGLFNREGRTRALLHGDTAACGTRNNDCLARSHKERKQGEPMRILTDVIDTKTLFRAGELKPSVILMTSAMLLAIHRSFGSIEFGKILFPSASDLAAPSFMFVCAFVLLGLIPFVMVALIFRDPIQDYGINLGDWKMGLRLTSVLFPIIGSTLLFPASQTAEMRAFYPFDKDAMSSVSVFIQLELTRGIFFYTAWEFFFRGFMLFGLRRYVGDWLAICIQTIPACLWHIGMPTGEIISSIAGSILFGILAIRTRSILWPFLLHYFIGVGLDLFIVVTS